MFKQAAYQSTWIVWRLQMFATHVICKVAVPVEVLGTSPDRSYLVATTSIARSLKMVGLEQHDVKTLAVGLTSGEVLVGFMINSFPRKETAFFGCESGVCRFCLLLRLPLNIKHCKATV